MISVKGADLEMLQHVIGKIEPHMFDVQCPDRNAVYTCINEARRIVGLQTPGWCQGGLHYYTEGPCRASCKPGQGIQVLRTSAAK